MPKKYLKCVESELDKGKSKDDAQRICAISFYKRHGISVNEAHSKGMFQMNTFSEHKSTKNDDGTFNILDVPIFELGEHRGQRYDQDWMTHALNNFISLKTEKKFLPRVIIGHTNDKDEKPAVGFLDNLKLQGKTVYADLTKLAQKTFDEIKSKAWPSRSVEVNPLKKKFTALALLGGSEPYFQFEPIDVAFKADPDGQWVDFIDGNVEMIHESSLLKDIWQKMLEFFKESKHGETEMTSQEIQKMIDDAVQANQVKLEESFNQKFEEKYNARFKEQFGKEPKAFMDDLEKGKIQKFDERKKAVLNSLKNKIAPKLVDGFFAPVIDAMAGIESQSIKFAETQEGDIFDLLAKFGEALEQADQDNALFVDLGEYAKFGGDGENPNWKNTSTSFAYASEEELQQYHEKIQKYAENHNVSYDQAAEKVLAGKK
jgi:hypothetical protein